MSKSSVPFIRSPYNYDLLAASDEATVANSLPSLTVQSQTEDADINTIVRRFGITGQVPQGARPIMFGDFDQVVDFKSAQDAVIQARESFMQQPAEVRSRFGNDPQAFLEFCSASRDGQALDNLEEMRRLGLAVPAPPAPSPAVPEAPPVKGGAA